MIYLLTGGFMLLDIITGLISSIKNGKYASNVMREGLFHKCGSVLCIVFGMLVDYTQKFLDLGVTIPMALALCTYIVLMEIGSIIENLCSINPEMMPEKLKSYFAKLSKEVK